MTRRSAALAATGASIQYGTHWLGVLSPVAKQLHSTSSLGLPTGAPTASRIATRGRGCSSSSLFYLWLLREAWRGGARLGLAACGLLLATSSLQPWHAVWAVPLAVVEDYAVARVLALSAYFLRNALPL